MGFSLTLLFIFLAYMSPEEVIPALAPLRPMLALSFIGMIATAIAIPMNRFNFTAPQIYLLIGLMGMVAFSVIAQGWFGGALIALEEFAISALVFFMVAVNAHTLKRLRILAALIVVISIYLAIQGAFAFHTGYGEDKFVWIDWQVDEQTGVESRSLVRIRGAGFLQDPNDLSQNFLAALPFLGIFWKKRRFLRNLFFVLVPAAVILYGVLLTHSRGALLGLVVLTVVSLKRRLSTFRSAVLGVGLCAGLLALNFAGGRGISMSAGSGRLEAWSQGIQMLKRSPIWGVGYGEFTNYHIQTAHNSFVLCFAELGLVGYFFWLALIVITVMELRALERIASGDEPRKQFVRSVRMALYTFLVTSWFLSRTYIPTLYLLIGMAVALSAPMRQKAIPGLPRLDMKWFNTTLALQFASVMLIYITLRLR